MIEVDRKTIRVLLACLELEVKELAEHMGYDAGYVANVINGFTEARPAFRRAFGETIGSLVLGTYHALTVERYPAAPLVELILRRAAEARSKRDFYRDLGVSGDYLKTRDFVDGVFVDRVCCALGVHPTAVYGTDYVLMEAS
ncbi:MAG: hypothetical protein M3285_01090 [Actinomycetota bacterium]|nr:hypothetical protein [Actinomycetota bacterium]